MPLDFNNKTDSAQWIRQQSPTKMAILSGFTEAGVMPDLSTPRANDLIGALSHLSAINWSKTYATAKSMLSQELSSSLKSGDTHRSAQLKIAAQEFAFLTESPPDVRYSLIQGLRHNDEKFQQIKEHALKVYQMAVADPRGENPFTSEQQTKVIRDVDAIDPKPLQLELKSINKVIAAETDPKIKTQLEQEKTDLLSALAAPFVERCRLAAISFTSNDPGDEEFTLKDAMQSIASIPAEAWQLEANQKFREGMTYELKELHDYNYLPDIFDANLPKLDIDHNGAVSKAELQALEKKHDPELTPLINLLLDYYETLTEKHVPLISKDGITRDDIKPFYDEHHKRPNDLRMYR